MGKGKRDRGGGGGGGGRDGPENTWANVIWAADGRASFKMEQENCGITDGNVDNWISAVKRELDWTEGKGCSCSSLNLSRNDLTDIGVQKVMRFLIKMRVSVGMLKLFKNSFGDQGMQAIGEFIHALEEPVQEIHLSHNHITWKGALSVFEAVKDCGHYPCNRGKDGTPLWLRMENNNIDWKAVIDQLERWAMSMSIGDNRDSWKTEAKNNNRGKGAECPLVAMHYSYHHQNVKEKGGGKGMDHHDWEGADDYGQWDGGDGYDQYAELGRRRDRERERSERDRDRERRSSTAAASSAEGSGGRRRDRDRGSERIEWNMEYPKEDELEEVSNTRKYIDQQMQKYSDQQTEKFKLVFSVLDDLQKKQGELEQHMQEFLQASQQQMMQMQQPAPQQFAVQMMQVPVDGGGQPQNWGPDRRPNNVVW